MPSPFEPSQSGCVFACGCPDSSAGAPFDLVTHVPSSGRLAEASLGWLLFPFGGNGVGLENNRKTALLRDFLRRHGPAGAATVPPMSPNPEAQDRRQPGALLRHALESGRVHSSFLLAGGGDAPRAAAVDFVRGVVCRGEGERPCGTCRDCMLSGATREEGEIVIDGTGKAGPLYRHIGDHPDLYWIDRGEDGTRVRITQVRALQHALRLASNEGGWRAAVIADAEWLNLEAQNALLHLLEEPPQRTCLVLVTGSPAGLLATIRSRCQKAIFGPAERSVLRGEGADEEVEGIALRLDAIHSQGTPELLDWAEEYRGARAVAAARVQVLLAVGSEWLRTRAANAVTDTGEPVRGELDAFRTLVRCRKDLAQRNANPQMIAERALFAVRSAVREA